MNDACAPIVDVASRQAQLEAFRDAEHPRCVMCGQHNAQGSRLRFRVQADGSVLALYLARDTLQSYRGTLHGGVVSSLLDAAMTNALFSLGVVAVTAELTVRFLAPVALDRGTIVRAHVDKVQRPLYEVRAELEQDRQLMAHASARFLVKGVFEPTRRRACRLEKA